SMRWCCHPSEKASPMSSPRPWPRRFPVSRAMSATRHSLSGIPDSSCRPAMPGPWRMQWTVFCRCRSESATPMVRARASVWWKISRSAQSYGDMWNSTIAFSRTRCERGKPRNETVFAISGGAIRTFALAQRFRAQANTARHAVSLAFRDDNKIHRRGEGDGGCCGLWNECSRRRLWLFDNSPELAQLDPVQRDDYGIRAVSGPPEAAHCGRGGGL